MFGGSRRTRGKDERETHLRLFGVGGAARHQKGVALFRVRHARGSGHRRRSAQVTRTRLGAGLQHVAVTNDKSSISYETQSHACICPKDETVRAPISFSFSFWEKMKRKAFSRRGSRERSRLRLRGRVALFLFPPERAPHGERADQVDEAQHEKLRLGVPPRGDEREKREKDKETPDDG